MRSRREASLDITSSDCLYSAAGRSLLKATSDSPIMAVRGLFSSWEALLIKLCWRSKEVSKRSSILLNVSPRSASTSGGSCVSRRDRKTVGEGRSASVGGKHGGGRIN